MKKALLSGILVLAAFVGAISLDAQRPSLSVSKSDVGFSFGFGGGGWGNPYLDDWGYPSTFYGWGAPYRHSNAFVGVGLNPVYRWDRERPVSYRIRRSAEYNDGLNRWSSSDFYRDGGFTQVSVPVYTNGSVQDRVFYTGSHGHGRWRHGIGGYRSFNF